MKIRLNTLWKVPVYCAVASWLSFFVTAYLGGFFFTVKTVDADGMIYLSTHPVRTVIFEVILFLVVLLVGGLWAFRTMTKAEIALSAGIASAMYLLLVLVQLFWNVPVQTNLFLAYFQNWTGILASYLMKLTDFLPLSVITASFAPLLFIPFGRKKNR